VKPFLPYIVILALHLAFIAAGNEQWVAVTKPLLISSLLVTAVILLKQQSHSKIFLLAGLALSLTGDVLLLFQQRNSLFFMLGLGAFLLAHIGYIFLFTGIRKQLARGKKFNQPAFIAMGCYVAALLSLLFPKLGGMAVPVLVYSLTIGSMLLAAVHAVHAQAPAHKWTGVLGAALFVLSDSLLAINKFHTPFAYAGFAIMLTYGLAQLFIVRWAVAVLPLSERPRVTAGG
jgi:uncharacterized membrane protein YhhN